MAKAHPKNERIKRKYLHWLATAKGASQSTSDKVAASIAAFENSTGGKAFSAFHIEQPMKFQRDLKATVNQKTQKPLAKATIRSRLMEVKAFFKWLADQQGYKSKISHADCEYFNMSANDNRIATARREKPIPTLEQINHVLSHAPHETALEKRDRAIIAFTILTGMRDAAIASLPIGKVNTETGEVFQDARCVHTKFAKTLTTFFFPIEGNAGTIVADWVQYLREAKLFSDTDPLFPKTETELDADGLFKQKIGRDYWTSAAPIRRIFREQFEAAGLPYFPPHQFRKTLMRVAYKMQLNPEALKAWSQNLGHENLATSLNSYGKVNDWRTAEIMKELADSESEKTGAEITPELLETIAKKMRRSKN